MRSAANALAALPFRLEGKRVVEVGTGRRVDIPIGCHLLGADSVDSYDLHAYLREDIVLGSLGAMLADRAEVVRTLARLADSSVIEQRLERLAGATSLSDLLRIAGIRYHAPSDAARTPLPDASVDLHFSFTVFEHIPADSLRSMLREASRVLAPGGLACHVIDPSDRFAHSDASVNFVNFLRYSDAEFARYDDNQFASHNRLRVTGSNSCTPR